MRALSVNQINKLLEKKDSLTEKQKDRIVDSIYRNKKANEIAMNGALYLGHDDLAIHLFLKRLNP